MAKVSLRCEPNKPSFPCLGAIWRLLLCWVSLYGRLGISTGARLKHANPFSGGNKSQCQHGNWDYFNLCILFYRYTFIIIGSSHYTTYRFFSCVLHLSKIEITGAAFFQLMMRLTVSAEKLCLGVLNTSASTQPRRWSVFSRWNILILRFSFFNARAYEKVSVRARVSV